MNISNLKYFFDVLSKESVIRRTGFITGSCVVVCGVAISPSITYHKTADSTKLDINFNKPYNCDTKNSTTIGTTTVETIDKTTMPDTNKNINFLKKLDIIDSPLSTLLVSSLYGGLYSMCAVAVADLVPHNVRPIIPIVLSLSIANTIYKCVTDDNENEYIDNQY